MSIEFSQCQHGKFSLLSPCVHCRTESINMVEPNLESPEWESLQEFQFHLEAEIRDLHALLIYKNKRYGNSALEPVRVFAKSDTEEQLNVRLDDKINRIANNRDGDTEDTEQDLLGYLVLKRVLKRITGARK